MPKKFKFAKPPKKDEDLEPSALILKEGGLCCREETKFYPKLSTKMKGKSRWTDAFEDENVFGDDPLEGFMGLEVYHGNEEW